jgi:glycerophosphoryl diester phosphodiesterase
MKIIYHKMSKEFPNKIIGFKNSIKNGITKFEMDIRISNDKLVLHHDNLINNEYLSNLDNNNFSKLDLFNDFIIEFNKHSGLEIFFDIKGNNKQTIFKLIEKIKLFNPLNKYYFQSFNYEFIKILKQHNKDYICGLIFAGYPGEINDKNNSIDYIAIEEEFIDNYIEMNKKIYLWTINNNNNKTLLEEQGIEGIFTDYPLIFLDK